MNIPKATTAKEIIAALYKNRGLTNPDEIESFLHPQNPMTISLGTLEINTESIKLAIERINLVIKNNEKVVIYGDYDADGICATAVLWHALALLGIPAIPFIPNREKHGYGISISGIDEVIEKYSPDLIITVDNGIVAHEPSDYIADKNIDLIITDHHQTDDKKPKALSVIHSDKICGTAMAWVLTREVHKHFPDLIDESKTIELLDLVAIGTIADMMPMVGINRSFAMYGLKALTDTKRPGLKAMKEEAGIDEGTELSSYHVGFIIGPRINAMGRIDNGIDALRLLCTKDSTKANDLAMHLGNINRDRQLLTGDAVELAISMYEADKHLQSQRIIVINHEDFHEGIIGLIAGKLVEKYYKPAIVIARGKIQSKGSARSISGVNIIELIREVDELLLGAGGHPGAAGLSVDTSKITEFQTAIESKALEIVSQDALVKSTNVELEIPLELVSLDLYEKLEHFAPFGIGNQRPIFESEVQVVDHRIIGKQGTHLKMTVKTDESEFIDAIGFGMAEETKKLEQSSDITLAYSIDKNVWNGKVTVQLLCKDIF